MRHDNEKKTASTSPADAPGGPFSSALFTLLSHELKAPISSIESLLKVISDGFTGETNRKTLDLIKSALSKTKEARTLIGDLLSFEKYSAGGLKRREEDLAGLVTKAFHRFKPAAAEKNIDFSLQAPPATRVILSGEAEGLSLAFGNLIENAVKYTEEDGRIMVALGADPSSKTAVVTVADTGAGISREDLDRLFTPFFRSPALKTKHPGTGLGLSIVKRIVEEHGGQITVDSSPQRGTTFTVQLPFLRLEHSRERFKKSVVIIGGVTAGPKAAARLRRLDEDCEITIIEKSEFLSYAGCGIPSYLAGKVASPKALMSTADRTIRDVYFFEHIKDIKILNKTLALSIDREKKEVAVKSLAGGEVSAVPYDVLVLATGAQSVLPPIPGIEGEGVHSLYKIEDAERIKQIFANHPAADVYIIGGGLIGVETAESLMESGARVTILEKDSHILKLFDPDISYKIREILSLKGIKIITGISIQGIRPDNSRSRIVTDQGDFDADLIILSAGVKPNAEIGRAAGLSVGPRGGIVVDEYLRTSDPAVYAIGDCAETKCPLGEGSAFLPLGSVSTKMGRIAADNIAGKKVSFRGGIGTTMFRIFDTAVARTGLGMEEARGGGLDPVSVVVSGLDRTHYYRGAEDVVIKVIADRATKRLLGAQGYGRGDLVPRIEILACALSLKLTLPEIFALDLGYFPAFNSPIDILQTACIVLENKIDGLLETVTLDDFLARADQFTVVDVSPIADFSMQAVNGSVNYPLENLRGSSLPFDKNEPIVLCSKTSSRAYEAFRYLAKQGFSRLQVLEGGYIHYKKG